MCPSPHQTGFFFEAKIIIRKNRFQCIFTYKPDIGFGAGERELLLINTIFDFERSGVLPKIGNRINGLLYSLEISEPSCATTKS